MRKIYITVTLLIVAFVVFCFSAQAQQKKPAQPGGTRIVFEITPDTSIVTFDGKNYGPASGLADKGIKATPGKHAVKIENGRDQIEADVDMKSGQRLVFKYEFEDSGASRAEQKKQEQDKLDQERKPDEKPAGENGPSKSKEEVVDLPAEPTAVTPKP